MDHWVLLVKLLTSIAFAYAVVIFSFTVFKIPIRQNDKQVTILALAFAFSNFYFKIVMESSLFFIFQTIVFVIVLMVLRSYPFLYAMFIGIFNFFVISVLDAIISIIGMRTVSSLELMQYDLTHYAAFHLIMTFVLLLISYILAQTKAGFSFIVRRFNGKMLHVGDYLFGFVLILILILLQVSADKLIMDSLQGVFFIVLILCLIGMLIHTYQKNQKVRKDRFGGR